MSFSRLSFDITNACNLKCAHCLRIEKSEIRYLPIEIFEKALNQSKRYGTEVMIFTGGEPFLHPQLADMADMVAKAGMRYYVVSNGTLLNKIKAFVSNEARLKSQLSISISLEGGSEETNDAIRGKGVYRKIMATTAYLKSKNITFGYKQSVNTLNIGEMEKFTLDAFKLGASYIEFSHMHPTPELVKRGLILPRSKWRDVDAEIVRLKNSIKGSIFYCAGGYLRHPFAQCSALQMNDVHVDYRGNVCLCCLLPYYGDADTNRNIVAGNLAEMDLWDAHNKLVDMIARFQKSKIQKIANDSITERDHYPCIYCFKHFGKFNWLKDVDPQNEWLED